MSVRYFIINQTKLMQRFNAEQKNRAVPANQKNFLNILQGKHGNNSFIQLDIKQILIDFSISSATWNCNEMILK